MPIHRFDENAESARMLTTSEYVDAIFVQDMAQSKSFASRGPSAVVALNQCTATQSECV
jgi:hypothetical protein